MFWLISLQVLIIEFPYFDQVTWITYDISLLMLSVLTCKQHTYRRHPRGHSLDQPTNSQDEVTTLYSEPRQHGRNLEKKLLSFFCTKTYKLFSVTTTSCSFFNYIKFLTRLENRINDMLMMFLIKIMPA